jgi:hypothetical protein
MGGSFQVRLARAKLGTGMIESKRGIVMKKPLEKIAALAMALPEQSRAVLAIKLIASLDSEPAESLEAVERAWVEVAEKRMQDIKSGKVTTRPAHEAMGEIRARFAN